MKEEKCLCLSGDMPNPGERKSKRVEEKLRIQMKENHRAGTFPPSNFYPELVHKLNGPLATVIGYAQLLLLRELDPEVKKELGQIIKEAHRASQILKDHMNLIRREKPRKEVADLNSLIDAVLEDKTLQLKLRKIDVVREPSPNIPLIQVDPKQIMQVLLNLINNAEEAISEFRGFGEIKVKTYMRKDTIEIVISDDGPGIQQENIPKIFDPFFTTKVNRTGLGLAISRGILEEHDGTLRVESERGRGATFVITLPITVIESKEKEKRQRLERDLKGMKGLVIDDDLNIVNMISMYLEEQGCVISTATDIKIALSVVEALTFIEEFDFIICDIKMPEMSGIDFFHVVEKKTPILKDRIIFSTGDVLSDATREFICSIPNPYIEKPFNLSELKEIIKKM